MKLTVEITFPEEFVQRLTRIEELLEAILQGDPEQLLTGPQVEKMLHFGATKLRRLREDCVIPCIGEGTGIRYRRSDVLAYARKKGILFPTPPIKY